jgi:uncharacterized membrane protein
MGSPGYSAAGICRLITFSSLALLVALQLLASWQQQPPGIVWVFRIAPLLIFVPGMIADKLRSYIWLCFVSLLYFTTLVLRLFAEPSNLVAILAMASVVSLFIGAMLYVRWRGQELREV